jgi:hypothetical protein
MKDAKPIKTPMGTNGHLDLDTGGKFVDQKVYRSMIRSLLYLCASRPDIMLSVCMCARFQANPKEVHLRAVSAFRTREDRQPTSEFVATCPCPDGLMQDGTQEGNEAYVISHRGARSRGYKRRERARTRARERESLRESVSACLVCPASLL